MKKTSGFIKFLGIIVLLLAGTALHAQNFNMTGTVITQPCNNNGQIAVTATNLTAPVTFTYSNYIAGVTVIHSNVNSTTDNLSNIGAYGSSFGSYNWWSITASDGTNFASLSMSLTAPFTNTFMVTPATCPALSTVQAIGFQGGTSPYSVIWTNKLTTQTYSTNPAVVANGQYSVVITDGAGCKVTFPSDSMNGIYVKNQTNITLTVSGAPANCTNGTATVTASGGLAPYFYLWSNNATSQSVSGLVQGQLTCTVTDSQGCSEMTYHYVNQAVTFSINMSSTSATCLQNNGSALMFVSGGVAPYTYLWSNGATSANLSAVTGGTYYSVTVTDVNGCIGLSGAYIGMNSPINVTYTSTASTCTAPSGSSTLTILGGTPPFTNIWYTFPSNTSGATISNKPSGTYNFKVTDAVGCVQTGGAFIPNTTTLTAFISNPAPICPATTGNLSAVVAGSHPPFTYLWSTAATTSMLTNAPLGAYTATITDAAGCKLVKNASLSQVSNINVGFNSTPASCLFSANGNIVASATGGQAPYTYTWSNSQTGATNSNLTTGYYYVSVTDANGCKNNYTNSQVYVGYNASNSSCYCTITGTVYNDINNNCTKNTGENGIANVVIHCSGMGYAFTNSNGVYSIKVPTGTYTITQTVPAYHPLATCQLNNQVVAIVAASNCTSLVNFANKSLTIHDLKVLTTFINHPVPGNLYTQKVIVENLGTVTESSVNLGYAHSGQLSYSNSATWTMSQQNSSTYPNWYSITSGFPSLAPDATSSSFVNYQVPTNTPLSTLVNFYDTVAHAAPINTTWLTDNSPWNNVDNYQATVIGSYDPNFKEVHPAGIGTVGAISTTVTELNYIIHFQNTGSYYAQNILLVDTLDSDLEFTSVRPGYSDHNYTTTMSDNGVLKFSFNNINLPFKSYYGDIASSGMVAYSVRLKPNLAIGTKIKNKAAIYFDYNEPVITNVTLNTIGLNSGIDDMGMGGKDRATLFPNPANNYFMLQFSVKENSEALFSIYDISGREVSTRMLQLQEGYHTVYENTDKLQNGIYFVVIKSENTLIQKKLLIAK